MIGQDRRDTDAFIKRAVEIGLWCYLIALPFRLQFLVNNFIGIDSPFHARYGSQFASRIFARTFPTTAYSIWRRCGWDGGIWTSARCAGCSRTRATWWSGSPQAAPLPA